jgi:toxin ParE1/3/4
MRVVLSEAALADLDAVLAYTATHYPTRTAAVENRIRATLARLARWPHSGREVDERPGVRVVALVRFPYKVFYRIADGAVEILHVHHVARETPAQF